MTAEPSGLLVQPLPWKSLGRGGAVWQPDPPAARPGCWPSPQGMCAAGNPLRPGASPGRGRRGSVPAFVGGTVASLWGTGALSACCLPPAFAKGPSACFEEHPHPPVSTVSGALTSPWPKPGLVSQWGPVSLPFVTWMAQVRAGNLSQASNAPGSVQTIRKEQLSTEPGRSGRVGPGWPLD